MSFSFGGDSLTLRVPPARQPREEGVSSELNDVRAALLTDIGV